MFFIQKQGSSIQCTYLPHVALKTFEFVDFVNHTTEVGRDMYILECSQDFEQSYVDHPDPYTHEISSYWQESFECGGSSPGDGSLTMVSMDSDAVKWATTFAGYQYVRKVQCSSTWTHSISKQVDFCVRFVFIE